MNSEIGNEERITEAFQDLARRAGAVDANNGPHSAGSLSRAAALSGGRGGGGGWPVIPALAFAVLAAVVGFGGWQLLQDDGPDNNIATNDIEDSDNSNNDDSNGDEDGATSTDDGGTVGIITEVSGQPDLAFVLVETDEGTRAGFPSILGSWIDLPADAQDALPDGEGGVFYTTDNTVVHQPASGGDPQKLAEADRPPQLLSARIIGERQAALALVDNSLIAYFSDVSSARINLDDYELFGRTEHLAIDGTTLAAIVVEDESRAVQTLDLDSGTVRHFGRALGADDGDAPLSVAVAGDQLVVASRDIIKTFPLTTGDDTPSSGQSFSLPASPLETGWWSFDASGNAENAQLIIGFGESALTINLDTGDRSVVPGVDGWVRSAHWAFAPDSNEAPTDPGDVATGDRYRVDTAKVAADNSDPFLNMRSEAGADQPLVAKLPPTYRGLRATGNQTETGDGATWLEFELLHPTRFIGDTPDSIIDHPKGWVNSALTLPLPDGIGVGLDEVAGCFDGTPGAIGGGLSGEAYVYGLESRYLSDNCLRVVLTLGQGATQFTWSDVPDGTGPAAALPAVLVPLAGGYGTTVDLGRTRSAWPAATETDDDIYITRGEAGNLQLVAPVQVGGVHLTPLPDFGVLVIDLEVNGPAPTADRFVALTSEPLVGAGSVTVTGIARPFEAQLGVAVVDGNEEPVTAVYSGSAFLGTLEGEQYGVGTNDWTEAWGRFAVKVDGLEPGQYTMLLDGQGGIDTPTPTRVPFTITDRPVNKPSIPTATETAAATALHSFARGGSFTDVPLADELTLALGLDEQLTRTRAELADRNKWTFDAADGFGGFSGPFNALDTLDGPGGSQVEYSAGPMNFCASPPKVWPAQWQALDQINVEPVGIDSCIAWYGISLFLNDAGEIEVIVLDLFGP